MGELFTHFKGWDVQAIRKESYEEALVELHDTVCQQVTEEVTAQVTESNIQKLLTILRNLGCSRETAIEQMMEQYQLTQEAAAAKADRLWNLESSIDADK